MSFFFQAEDGIRDLVRSRGLGDVYKRQIEHLDRVNSPYVVKADGLAAGKGVIITNDKKEALSLIHI